MEPNQYLPDYWSEGQLQIQQIANHIVATMLITMAHPQTGQQITRCGAAAMALPKKKERKHSSQGILIDLASLKAQCLQNAAGTLGKLFEPGSKKHTTPPSTAAGRGQDIPHQYLQDLYHRTRHRLAPQHRQHANRILQNRETVSYRKLFNQLKSIQQEYNN